MKTPASRLLNAAKPISIHSPGTARIASIAPRMSIRGPSLPARSGVGSGTSEADEIGEGDDRQGERAVQRPAHPQVADHEAGED